MKRKHANDDCCQSDEAKHKTAVDQSASNVNKSEDAGRHQHDDRASARARAEDSEHDNDQCGNNRPHQETFELICCLPCLSRYLFRCGLASQQACHKWPQPKHQEACEVIAIDERPGDVSFRRSPRVCEKPKKPAIRGVVLRDSEHGHERRGYSQVFQKPLDIRRAFNPSHDDDKKEPISHQHGQRLGRFVRNERNGVPRAESCRFTAGWCPQRQQRGSPWRQPRQQPVGKGTNLKHEQSGGQKRN